MFSEINHTQKLWLSLSVATFLFLIAISTILLAPNFTSEHSNVSHTPYVNAIYSLEDTEHQLEIEHIQRDDGLINKINSNPTTFGHTTATVWIKAVVNNPSSHSSWSINLSNRHFSPVHIYQQTDSGVLKLYQNDGEIIYNTFFQPTSPTALIDVPPLGQSVLYFKLRSLKTTFFLLTFSPAKDSYHAHQKSLALVLISIGLLICLVFVNMMMYFSLRKAYLALYSLQEVFIILLIIVESGIGINYFWVGDTYINNCASIISLLGLVSTAALFTRSFFDTKRNPIIDKILLIKVSLALLCLALSFLEPFRTYLLQGGLPFTFILSITIIFAIAFVKLKEGKTHALPYFLAFSLLIVFVIPLMYAIFSQSQTVYLHIVEMIALLCVCEAIMLCIGINMQLDAMRIRHNLFNDIWIDTLNERLTEVSRLSQLTDEKNSAVAGSISSIKRLSNTSHDIQHSLYSIRLHLEILSRLKSTDQLHSTVDKIENGLNFISDITQKLIDDGMNLITAEGEQIDFDEIFSAVIEQTAPLIKGKKIKLVYEKSNIRHSGSAVIIRRLLENLVRNALRHTHTGGVTISILHQGDHLKLNVSDTGKGMKANVVENLIRVTRSDDIAAVENSGYGLGLSIVSALCQQAGYTIHIESKQNSGTMVSIQIPILKLEQLSA